MLSVVEGLIFLVSYMTVLFSCYLGHLVVTYLENCCMCKLFLFISIMVYTRLPLFSSTRKFQLQHLYLLRIPFSIGYHCQKNGFCKFIILATLYVHPLLFLHHCVFRVIENLREKLQNSTSRCFDDIVYPGLHLIHLLIKFNVFQLTAQWLSHEFA